MVRIIIMFCGARRSNDLPTRVSARRPRSSDALSDAPTGGSPGESPGESARRRGGIPPLGALQEGQSRTNAWKKKIGFARVTDELTHVFRGRGRTDAPPRWALLHFTSPRSPSECLYW